MDQWLKHPEQWNTWLDIFWKIFRPISNNLGTLRPKLWHTPIIHEENPTHPKTSKKNLETIINHQHPSAILHHFMAFCPVFAHLFMVVSASSAPPPAVWVAAPPSAAPAAATATPASKPRPLWAQRRGGILVELDILRGWAVGWDDAKNQQNSWNILEYLGWDVAKILRNKRILNTKSEVHIHS